MNTDRNEERTRQARDFSRNDLDKVKSARRATQVNLGLLFNDMRGTLNWAVEHWLRCRGDATGGAWDDQEARFLRGAPTDLRDDYLSVAGGVARLAGALLDQLDAPGVQMIVLAALSLAPWREALDDWIVDVEQLIGRLLNPDVVPAQPGTKRIARGVLRGRLDGLTPCLLLAQAGGGWGRWRRCAETPGLFDFGEADAEHQSVACHHGLILPLTLCRDPELQRRLAGFAELIQATAASILPADAFGRRLALQAWLDREGLGFLHLADKEPCHRWVRFILSREVFGRLLGRFDYVTAMLDGADQPSRTLDQAPFRWTSQGDFLDWCLVRESDQPIMPFSLYLAADVSGCPDPFASCRERKRLVRPPAYWASWTQPVSCIDAAPVTVRFIQEVADYGWIELELGLGDQKLLITLSDVYDPFPALLEWLLVVAEGDLPIAVDIDEEGSEARLLAHRLDEHRLLVAVLDRYGEAERGAAVVDRGAFLEAFREELRRFLRHDLDTERWGSAGDDEEPEDAYRKRLLEHPFIA